LLLQTDRSCLLLVQRVAELQNSGLNNLRFRARQNRARHSQVGARESRKDKAEQASRALEQ
jgi:hypothetical protein